jgi:hypothetical protein
LNKIQRRKVPDFRLLWRPLCHNPLSH